MINIREKRKQLGISQKELAEACGITQSTLCDIEMGRSKPSIKIAIKIAETLHIDIDDSVKDASKAYGTLNKLVEELSAK